MGGCKLYYFDFAGRGEALRLALTMAGIEFEDVRFSYEQWPEYKKQSPSGQCPWLELEDGTTICESKAILLYAGAQAGLVPQTSGLAMGLCEQVVGLVDSCVELLKPFWLNGPGKEEALEAFYKRCEVVDAIISSRQNPETGFTVGEAGLTYADLHLFAVFEANCKLYLKIDVREEQYPHIAKAVAAVRQHPVVASKGY